ncbi:MAG: hypothetical protein KBT47_08970 [Armatimonadetes bacterium]|nr:hypothetical protein [Candidatus Hippobium faecium]
MKKTILILTVFLLCSASFAGKAILDGNRDLLITSSLGFDRNPCFLEWYQYDPNWKYSDSKVIRSTNETWVGCVAGDINQDGYIDFLTSLDNNQGYSHVRTYPIDRYASLRETADCYDNLPNEPWRHISGVDYADTDGDGENDLLIIGNDRNGDRHITCIFYKDGHISGETDLCDVPENAWNMSFCNNTVYVTVPNQEKITTDIIAYKFDSDFNYKGQSKIASFPKAKGKITGITVFEEKGKIMAVLCGHNWDTFESNMEEKNRKGAKANETYFLLPSIDLANTTSFLMKGEIKNGKLQNPTVFEEMKGRRWQDVTAVKNSEIKHLVSDIDFAPTKECLHIMGLFSNHYQFNKYFRDIDKWYVKVEAQTESLVKTGSFSDMGNYRYVIINNVPIYALGESGINALLTYAEKGGCVLFCNGLMSGATGGYRDSDFMKVLGLKLPHASKVAYTEKGVPYIAGTISDNAIISEKNDTVYQETVIGKGKICYIGITPNKEDLTEFYASLDSIMERIIR